jgi:hypothetical protein
MKASLHWTARSLPAAPIFPLVCGTLSFESVLYPYLHTGQRQIIALGKCLSPLSNPDCMNLIARAIVRGSKLMILDEGEPPSFVCDRVLILVSATSAIGTKNR